MARKRAVLGNDPFQRGAAERRPPASDAVREQPAAKQSAKQPTRKRSPANLAAKKTAATKPVAAKPAATKPAAAKPAAAKPAAAKPAAAKPAAAKPAAAKPTAAKPPTAKQPAARRPPTPLPPKAGEIAHAAAITLRQLLQIAPSGEPAPTDEFGRDEAFTAQALPLLEWIYRSWFRVETEGFDALPHRTPLILVANRAGALPWDSLMLTVATRHTGVDLRPLVEDSIFHLPSLGLLINRLGAVRACPENAERLLGAGQALAVFPEGAAGFGKPYGERYRLRRFGRGGFIKLALRTEALVVPVSIIGSEEAHPLLSRLDLRPYGFPFFPITPTFPWLGAAGLLPLPSKWRIRAGSPLDFREYGAAGAEDEPLILRLAGEVRQTVQAMLDEGLASRR